MVKMVEHEERNRVHAYIYMCLRMHPFTALHSCVMCGTLTLFHLVNVHVTLLIIPLQAAVRAPAEAVGLKLDLFHLKD